MDDTEDCNYVHKVFHGVPMGEYGHVEVGMVWKDLQGLRFFLGHRDIHIRYVRDGRPVAQLPFLALSILQSAGRFEGSTHFDMLPKSSTKEEFLERKLWWNLQEPSRLNCGLKICRMQKFLGPKKKLTCADSARTTDRMVWYRKNWPLPKPTAQREQGFELKVS